MTNSTPANFSTVRSNAATAIASVDWAKHQRRARAIALTVAVACYLTFLALRGAYRLGVAARALWEKYEISAKIAAAVEALKTEFDGVVPVSVRVAETRAFLASAKADAIAFADSAKAEANAITGNPDHPF